MRVLHVVTSGERRGAEVFASSLVHELKGSGILQRVFVLRPPAGLWADGSTSIALAPVGRGPVPGLSLHAAAVGALRAEIADWEPDALLAHGGEALKHAVAADRGRGKRVIYRRIGDATQFGSAKLRELVFSLVVRRTARVVAVADVLRDELVAHYRVPRERVVVISNGVDPRSVEPTRSREDTRVALGIDPDANVVLSLGALTWEKDPLAHLRAVGLAAATTSNVVHLIVGDGPLADDVKAAAAKAPVPTLVLGSRNDVGDMLNASDVMVVASRSEGMPACVIEAGMRELPVASYALSGIPEVVLAGTTGRLVPPGDEPALAGAIAELLSDPGTCARMGAAARERCLEHFDIRNVARRYAELFEEVAERRPRKATRR